MADIERTDFASFLRTRRERVRPEDVGLPGGGRRRTPGLRREELAMLAGISVDYLVRLEQGREVSPSPAVIRSLAEALGLTPDERAYMKSMVAVTTHGEFCPDMSPPEGPSAGSLRLLDRLGATPAFVIDGLTNVRAWNDAYDSLMRPTGLLDDEPPNLVRFTFLRPAARRLYRDWEAVGREQVGNLRAHAAVTVEDAATTQLVGELTTQSEDFVSFWACYDVAEKRTGTKQLDHPVGGHLDLDFTAMGLPEGGGLRLVTYLPSDEASAAVLDRLVTAAPARLRLVDGGA